MDKVHKPSNSYYCTPILQYCSSLLLSVYICGLTKTPHLLPRRTSSSDTFIAQHIPGFFDVIKRTMAGAVTALLLCAAVIFNVTSICLLLCVLMYGPLFLNVTSICLLLCVLMYGPVFLNVTSLSPTDVHSLATFILTILHFESRAEEVRPAQGRLEAI
jgi:hypothetical protein